MFCVQGRDSLLLCWGNRLTKGAETACLMVLGPPPFLSEVQPLPPACCLFVLFSLVQLQIVPDGPQLHMGTSLWEGVCFC